MKNAHLTEVDKFLEKHEDELSEFEDMTTHEILVYLIKKNRLREAMSVVEAELEEGK